MTLTSAQAETIAKLKSGSDVRSLPIFAEDETLLGSLTALSYKLAERADVVNALYRWRKANLLSFLTVFSPTVDKTESYLRKFSLPDPARILFLISEPDGRMIGHIGLCNIDRDSAELDNVLRGEVPSHRDIINGAQRALLEWAFMVLKVPLVYLNVLANNERAIRAYRKAGFVTVKHVPLVMEKLADGYRLVPNDVEGSTTHGEVARMEISGTDFGRYLSTNGKLHL